MPEDGGNPRAAIPSVDRLMGHPVLAEAAERLGRALVLDSARDVLAALRAALGDGDGSPPPDIDALAARTAERARSVAAPSLRPVFNLTGTVVHTNLGRSVLAPEAIAAVVAAAGRPTNLEFDIERGRRGDRDSHVETLICRLTGAEAATAVNNNAAAVLLVLNTFALGREVPVSRGELVEIGGAFRMPDIMAQAGCTLREVGTTNRTHLKDFQAAIGPDTGLVMKVHTSNYAIQGFTAAVPGATLAKLCADRGVPFAVDLGSGSLIDLAAHLGAHEETPGEALRAGADLVTFSGDKLLGGPQAGIIAGRKDLVAALKANPLKRALRLDKMTIAALSATLALYLDPDTVTRRVPTLRLLARPAEDIAATVGRVLAPLRAALGGMATVSAVECRSQIGSGALPVENRPSHGVAIAPVAPRGKAGSGTALKRLVEAFAALPVPVIGHVREGALILDMRCLEPGAEAEFVDQLSGLAP